MSDAAYERTERGARLVGAGIIVSRVLGLVRGWVFANYLGTTVQADAYTAASRIPNVLRNLLGEGAISSSFVPVYAAALERGDERGARALANALLGVLLVGVSALTLIGIAAAPLLTALLRPGVSVENAELTTRLMRVMFPMTGLMVLSGWCLGVQNAHHRFFMAYASGAMWSVTQIALLLVAGPQHPGLTTLAWWLGWATLAGAVLQIGAQVPQVMRLMGTVRPTLDLNVSGLNETLRNFIPVVGALGMFQISGFFDMFMTSYLADGALATLNYANMVYLLPLSLFGVATAAAALPQMARDHARGDTATVAPGFARSWERVLFYTIPSAIAFLGIGDCIVGLLYEGRGEFGSAERARVHVVLAAYALGLVAYSSSRLLAATYQATHNYRTPFRSAAVAIVISAVIGAGLALSFRERAEAVAALAFGGAIGAHVNLFLLWRGLRGQLGAVDLGGAQRTASRAFAAALIALAPSVGARFAMQNMSIHITALVVITVFCVVFLGAAQAMGVSEADRFISALRRRAGR